MAPRPAPPPPFILTFWCGPPLAEFDDARAAEIAAAHFTVVGPPCIGATDPEQNLRALDIAQHHGLRLWVADYRFNPEASMPPDWLTPLRSAADTYRGHAALGGYFVDDEPTVPEFGRVAEIVAALRAADPDHLAYVNLLPDYIPPAALGAATYAQYVAQFIATVQPHLLSFDYYPFGHEKDRSTFFANLATIRSAALRNHLPFMMIVLAMPHGPYRDPSESELAWQVHHALAYGARGISYFTYWTPPDSDEWRNDYGLIEDGRPTLHYFQVARLNRELRALAGALDGFESIAVVDSLGQVGDAFPFGPIDALRGGAITVGLFGDGRGQLAALLVNRDYRYGVTAQLQLRPGALPPEALDVTTGEWESRGEVSFVLPPGGARLVRWQRETGDGKRETRRTMIAGGTHHVGGEYGKWLGVE